MKLYEITAAIRAHLDAADPETGELPSGLDEVVGEFDAKASDVAAYILGLEADLPGLDAEIKRLTGIAKSRSNRANALRGYLAAQLKGAGKSAVADARWTIKLEVGRDVRVELEQDAEFGDEFLLPAKPRQPSREKIGAALKRGELVQGAMLVASDRLTIR